MGLCKCPKRKVTNQFCFEHRVNVCEHCMVKKHPQCVVQSYLQWLQDSDYDPNCSLCDQELSGDACVRLACYHLFHWTCLDRYARNLPGTTAPAGYTCPACKDCIFPPEKLVSPVADELKRVLSEVNWARAGLGLPLLEGGSEKRPAPPPTESGTSSVGALRQPPSGPRPAPEGQSNVTMMDGTAPDSTCSSRIHGDSVIQLDNSSSSGMQGGGGSGSRTLPSYATFSRTLQTSPLLLKDSDEDKYKRRPALSLLWRWMKNAMVGGPSLWLTSRRWTKRQRSLAWLTLFLFGFFGLIYALSNLREGDQVDDPLLDPRNSHNLRIYNEA